MALQQRRPSAEEEAAERVWLRAAQRGDAAAWRWLLAHHGPGVYALCLRLDPDPEDAYQEIWEKVHRHLPSLDGDRVGPEGSRPEPLGGWLRTVARRHLIDRHRRRQVRGEVLGRLEVPAPGADSQERILEEQERSRRLEAALLLLPLGQRRAVVLHHVEGLSLETIAAHESAALGTIKSRLHRARARLASLLGGHR